MPNKLTNEEITSRFAQINSLMPDTPTKSEKEAIHTASLENENDVILLSEYKQKKEFSGKLLLRIPKELHANLSEAAAENGVSLNQYVLYKLAK